MRKRQATQKKVGKSADGSWKKNNWSKNKVFNLYNQRNTYYSQNQITFFKTSNWQIKKVGDT